MKKTILPAIALATAGFLFSPFFLSAQTDITVQDDAKVGLIITGTGNTINTTQIFGKSPEYAELKKRLDGLQAAIAKKADECEQMAKDSLPAKYRDNCRDELIALNAERDSVQKIETRFREDVIRLAETFSRIEINSERLRLAKKFFDEGKISEADNVLKEKDMAAIGDAALAAKARNDSVLLQTANEFALKAQLKALQMDYDSAQTLFAQSQKYFETVDNLWDFAYLLGKQNQTPRAIEYIEKALKLARSESEEATLAMNLGLYYARVQKMAEAEKMYLRSLEIYERLALVSPPQFEPGLATTLISLGNFYHTIIKMAEAEKFYLRSLEIYERLALVSPPQFEPGLATTLMNLGVFYKNIQKMENAEKMYLRSLEIRERLAKSNLAQFEPDLALTCMNLGNFYAVVQEMGDAEKMLLRSQEIYERLAKSNPAQFESDLARTAVNLGNFYHMNQKMAEAEKMYLRSLEIYERLAKANPAQFEPALALTAMNLGNFYTTVQKMVEAEKLYLRSLDIYERLAKANRAEFEPYLARFLSNLSAFYLFVKKYPEAQAAAERALALDSSQNSVLTNLGHSHLLRGEWDKAKAVYEEYLNNEPDPVEAKKTLLQDWDELEKAGVTHPDMEKARKWVRE